MKFVKQLCDEQDLPDLCALSHPLIKAYSPHGHVLHTTSLVLCDLSLNPPSVAHLISKRMLVADHACPRR